MKSTQSTRTYHRTLHAVLATTPAPHSPRLTRPPAAQHVLHRFTYKNNYHLPISDLCNTFSTMRFQCRSASKTMGLSVYGKYKGNIHDGIIIIFRLPLLLIFQNWRGESWSVWSIIMRIIGARQARRSPNFLIKKGLRGTGGGD